MIPRRRFITGVVIALTPLGATASAQEYKARHVGEGRGDVRHMYFATVSSATW